MSGKGKSKSIARSEAAKETNSARAAKRRNMERWFRRHHTRTLASSVLSDSDFVDVEETLIGEFGEAAADGDLTLVVNKLDKLGHWVPRYPRFERSARQPPERSNAAADSLILLRAENILRRGQPDVVLFGSPEETARRSEIRAKLREVEALLAEASKQANRMGHNSPPDEAANLSKEIAQLRMVVSSLSGQIGRQQADLVAVVRHSLELQKIAQETARPAIGLVQIAAEKAAETFGATIGRGAGALASLYLAAQLVPALQAVVHLIAAWLAELIPGL